MMSLEIALKDYWPEGSPHFRVINGSPCFCLALPGAGEYETGTWLRLDWENNAHELFIICAAAHMHWCLVAEDIEAERKGLPEGYQARQNALKHSKACEAYLAWFRACKEAGA